MSTTPGKHTPRITHLVPGAYSALLRRWDKYNDPRNEDYEWDRADKNERHAINACLDLRDTLKANDDLLAAAKAALEILDRACLPDEPALLQLRAAIRRAEK